MPVVKAALEAIDQGGYPAALARTAELLERRGAPLLLARVERRAQQIKEYAELLPDLPIHEWKLIRGEQDVIVRFEPERALATLPRLLAEPGDRERRALAVAVPRGEFPRVSKQPFRLREFPGAERSLDQCLVGSGAQRLSGQPRRSRHDTKRNRAAGGP